MSNSGDGIKNGLPIFDGGVNNRSEDAIMLLSGFELAGYLKFDLYISNASFRSVVVISYKRIIQEWQNELPILGH